MVFSPRFFSVFESEFASKNSISLKILGLGVVGVSKDRLACLAEESTSESLWFSSIISMSKSCDRDERVLIRFPFVGDGSRVGTLNWSSTAAVEDCVSLPVGSRMLLWGESCFIDFTVDFRRDERVEMLRGERSITMEFTVVDTLNFGSV